MKDPLEKAITDVGRSQISEDEWNIVLVQLRDILSCRIKQQGNGVYVSPHELSGALTESFNEIIDGLHMTTHMPTIYKRLIDLAVTSLWGAASIYTMPNSKGVCNHLFLSDEPMNFVGARRCKFCGILTDVSEEA